MKRKMYLGKLCFINNHVAIAICRGRHHDKFNLDYSMTRAGIAQYSVSILPFQKKEIFRVKPLKKDKRKSIQIF